MLRNISLVEYQKTLKAQLNDLSYSMRRYYVDEFHFRQAAGLASGSSVLDLGGTKIAKRGLFNIEQFNLRVIYANLTTRKLPDVQSDAEHLPFCDESFDVVICAELLEHVPDPSAVLREVYRVLKPGGTLLITVPFLYQIHGDPYDYGRYTDFYWQKTLTATGFSNIEIEKQGYFWSVMIDFVRAWLYEREKSGRLRLLRQNLKGVVARARHHALKREARPGYKTDLFYTSFTTGFGIRCIKER